MSIRVLLVDDDEDLLGIAQAFLTLEESGLELVTTTLVHEAFHRLKEQHFDAVVSDYQMPQMDGLTFLQKLRVEGNDIPFIMFTGRGREEVAIKALNLGANYYLKKGGEPQSQYDELVHIIRSVVQHKRTKEALQQSEQKFRVFADHSLVSIAILQDEKVVYVNKAISNLTGYSQEEILGWTPEKFANVIDSQDRAFVMGQFQKKQTKSPDVIPQYDFRLVTKTGQTQWVTLNSTYFDMATNSMAAISILNITERKQMEEALRESEEVFRAVFKSLPAPAALWRRQANGEIILAQANTAGLGLARGMVAQQIGMTLEQIHGDDLEIFTTIQDAMFTNRPTQAKIFERRNYRGEMRQYLVDCVKPTEDTVLAIARDMTSYSQAT